jgi:hypothetical protein
MRHPVRMCAVAAASLAAGALIGYPIAHAADVTASITVHPGTVGNPLTAGFGGFSLSTNELRGNDFASSDLRAYLRTLGGTGVIRVGGNSQDETFWTSSGESAPSWATGTITPDSLKPLAALVKATGWRVVLGLNLKHDDPDRAADEAKHAQQAFGSSLLGVEIGNEPGFYLTSTSAYFSAFEANASAIKAAAPGVGLIGPDPNHNSPDFLAAFASHEAAHPDVAEVTDHSYPTSACGSSHASLSELLSTSSVQNETDEATAVVSAARKLNVPAGIDETNSTVCGGTTGVGDVFGAALWGLDYSLLLAQHGVANAEFEGTTSGCSPYSPLCTSDGKLVTQPLYYGMLATALVGTGNFVSVSNPDSASLRAYAVKNGRDLTVVLDDVQDPSSNGPTTVSLNLGADFQQGQMALLATSSGSGLSAKSDITLGGQKVSSDGSFPAPDATAVSVSGQTAEVSVKAGSAAIIRFSGGVAQPAPHADPSASGSTSGPAPTPSASPSGAASPSRTPSPSGVPSPSGTRSRPPVRIATPGSAGGLAGFFAPDFSGAAFCRFPHQNVTVDNGQLTVFYPAGSTAPSAGAPFGGAQECVPFSAGPGDTLALTYSVRFPSGFQFVKGGQLPGIYGGRAPFSGGSHNPNGWSMRLMWGAGGKGGIFAYTAKTAGFGDAIGQGKFSWQADGQWHTVTERVTVNTPGAANGSVTLSYNGQQVIHQGGIDITDTRTPATGLFFSTFFGGHDRSWAPTANESISFKNFSATRQ